MIRSKFGHTHNWPKTFQEADYPFFCGKRASEPSEFENFSFDFYKHNIRPKSSLLHGADYQQTLTNQTNSSKRAAQKRVALQFIRATILQLSFWEKVSATDYHFPDGKLAKFHHFLAHFSLTIRPTTKKKSWELSSLSNPNWCSPLGASPNEWHTGRQVIWRERKSFWFFSSGVDF